jgi:uncharacterized protein (DUF934 family)
LKDSLRTKLEKTSDRFEEIGHLLADPAIAGGSTQFRELSMEYARLEPVAQGFRAHLALEQELAAAAELANDADPRRLDLSGVTRIDLQFPKFTDGRAYSQAFLLRRRLGFEGELRATGDVLIDQLVQMQRTGFDVAVLREGVDASAAQRQFERFAGFYQGSAVGTHPQFAKAA